ncbi:MULTISPECIES: universal stress protein [Salinibaculum]|uniref:universal stress protein n=1 Tax=Salinibaculum TaxID=2732368 RepID=UPI0030CAC0EE
MTTPSLGGLLSDASEASEHLPRVAGRFDGDHVLAPLLTAARPTVTDQLTVATTLANVSDASLSLVTPVAYPDQMAPVCHQNAGEMDESALLEWALTRTEESEVYTERGLLYTRDLVRRVLRTVRANDVDTLVLPSGAHVSRLRKGLLDQIAAQAACDVVVVNGQSGYDSVTSILLPVAGGPHSGLAADLARSIAVDCDAWVDVLHVVDAAASERERQAAQTLVGDIATRIGRPDTTTTWVLEERRTAQAIAEQSRYYDLTVIGAPTKGRLRRLLYGSTNRSVRDKARSVVLSARSNSHRPSDTVSTPES